LYTPGQKLDSGGGGGRRGASASKRATASSSWDGVSGGGLGLLRSSRELRDGAGARLLVVAVPSTVGGRGGREDEGRGSSKGIGAFVAAAAAPSSALSADEFTPSLSFVDAAFVLLARSCCSMASLRGCCWWEGMRKVGRR